MLDMQLVENTIQELEDNDTTFNNCEKLASLYIVRHFNSAALNQVSAIENDIVGKELTDILPNYQRYCEIKRQYQLTGTEKEAVLTHIAAVCKEVLEFLHMLYNNTDLPEERHIIEQNLSNIQF